MICKNELHELLDASFFYVLGEEECGDVKSLFLRIINNNEEQLAQYISGLDYVKEILKEDLDFFMVSDPAATSLEEIKLAYPGYKAIAVHRIALVLYVLGYKVEARIFAEFAHSETGIDIHPAAKIGHPFFIDHGTGIVVGETATIGKRVKLYQGVTLGAVSLSNASSLRGVVRHPQVGDDVTIYAGASLLGAIKIGNNVTIGSNVYLIRDVENNMRVTIGEPELIYKSK